MYTELTEAVKMGTAAADGLRRLMHVSLKAAAKARIKKQIVDDIHNKYEVHMRAQQIREEIEATAEEANMAQKQTAPVRAMARELLGIARPDFPIVSQLEANAFMRIKGLSTADVKYSLSELYEISKSIAAHHGPSQNKTTLTGTPANAQDPIPPDPQATEPEERPMPDLMSESGSTKVSTDSDTIPDLASASTSGSDSDDSQTHILSTVDIPGSTLYGEEARDRPPLIYELPLEVQRHEVNYRMNMANASSDYWRPSPPAAAELLDPVTPCGLKGCDACDQAIKVSTSRYRLFRDDPDEQGRDECNAAAAQAEHLRDMAYAEHLQSSLDDLDNHHMARKVDPDLGGGAGPARTPEIGSNNSHLLTDRRPGLGVGQTTANPEQIPVTRGIGTPLAGREWSGSGVSIRLDGTPQIEDKIFNPDHRMHRHTPPASTSAGRATPSNVAPPSEEGEHERESRKRVRR